MRKITLTHQHWSATDVPEQDVGWGVRFATGILAAMLLFAILVQGFCMFQYVRERGLIPPRVQPQGLNHHAPAGTVMADLTASAKASASPP